MSSGGNPMVEITTLSELTIDGKLSLGRSASSKDLFLYSTDELKAWFHTQRAANDAIMVGANTVRVDDPELTVRHVQGRNPLRVIHGLFTLGWMLLLGVGVTSVWTGLFHVFAPEMIASAAGRRVSVFQYEVGIGDIAIGLVAIDLASFAAGLVRAGTSGPVQISSSSGASASASVSHADDAVHAVLADADAPHGYKFAWSTNHCDPAGAGLRAGPRHD